MSFRLVLIFILSTVFASPALAEEPSAGRGQEGHEQGAHHRHHIIVFLGTTRVDGENEDSFGVEYQYRAQAKMGFGGLVDHARGPDATAVAAAVYLHPVGDLEFIIAGLG